MIRHKTPYHKSTILYQNLRFSFLTAQSAKMAKMAKKMWLLEQLYMKMGYIRQDPQYRGRTKINLIDDGKMFLFTKN